LKAISTSRPSSPPPRSPGADAIHPGYGFLSENTHFAEVCESCHITFIGPSKDAIRKMGDKAEARKIMGDYGVPIIPGTKGCIDVNDKDLDENRQKIGFPILVKAKAGGGGKGMRVVQDAGFLEDAITAATERSQGRLRQRRRVLGALPQRAPPH
jgi:acetyl-CoA carboxylase biotin carboxylase subunit